MNRLRHMSRGVGLLALLLAAGTSCSSVARNPSTAPSKAAGAEALPPLPMVMEPHAVGLLKAMTDRLSAARSMGFTAVVEIEAPSRLGPPLIYASRYDVTMRRPDQLRVILSGDGPASELYYDGQTIVAYAPAEDVAAVAPAPPTIDAALKQAFDNAAIYFPFTDVIAANPGALLIEGGKLAFTMGQSRVVGGTRTDIVAWADDDVFVQIWIGTDDKLPRRVRAVYRNDPLRLRHDMALSNWRLNTAPAWAGSPSARARAAPRIPFARPDRRAPGPGAAPQPAPHTQQEGTR